LPTSHSYQQKRKNILNLFLLSSCLVLLSLLSLFPNASIPSVRAGNTQFPERIPLFLSVGDSALGEFDLARASVDRKDGSGRASLGGGLSLLPRGVAELGLIGTAGEEDELRSVFVESGDVGLEGLDRGVLSTMVDGDPDAQSKFTGDIGFLFIAFVLVSSQGLRYRGETDLELLEGESTASTNTAVVFDGRAPNDGAKEVDRSRSYRSNLGQTSITTTMLASGL